MKIKTILLPMLAGGSLILPSWGDSAAQLIQAETKEAPTAGAELSVVPNFDVNAMAKKLGFAAHVPKNTEGYLSVIGGNDMFERLTKTEIGEFVIEMMAGQGADLEEMEEDEDIRMLKAVLGEEIFAAFGDTSGAQGVHLNAIAKSSNFHQMKMLVKMAAMNLSGDADPEEMQGAAMGMFSSMLGDPKAGIPILEKAEMPPITLGFKVSDADMREQLSETIIGILMSLFDDDVDSPFKEIDQKMGEVQLSGMTIVGKKLAAMPGEDERKEMAEVFGSDANVDRFLKAVETKNLSIASGVKGEYVFIYLGGSLDGLKLVDKAEDSLLANPGLDFLKGYADKDIRMFLFGEEEALDQMSNSNEVLASMARGLKTGLSETDVFGDTRDIQALLGHVASVEGTLFDMVDADRTGLVGFLEEGFKIESHGGSNLPMIDTDKPHTFSALGEMDDVLYFSNTRTNPEFTAKLFDMMDSLGQATYLMAGRVTEMDIDDGDFLDFKEGFQMYEQMAAGDLKEIWSALTTDWAQGTGDEGAFIIDTRGTLPKIPEVPGAIIEKGRIPRIAYVAPVTDRAKMKTAWTRIEKSITNILKTVKEMDGREIPMQEIDDNTKEGVTYYSTAIQFSTRDARPVVGMTDDRFFFSTSQKFIAEMNAKLDAGEAPVRKGAYTRMNFAALRGLAEYWVTLLKENSDDIFENDFQKDDFNENLPLIERAIKAFGQLEEMTSHTRKEGDETRSSIHFKMK
ncbi:MAG: hypothetical protein ACJA1W_000295 [Akkermansiaceae bacterium]|jgi:hypothetical protein